jgi:outer membrane protein OmpA-like peptidoglycan-associated protein
VSATTVPGESIPVAVPALLVVVAAASATVAVALMVPALEARSQLSSGERVQTAEHSAEQVRSASTPAPEAAPEAAASSASASTATPAVSVAVPAASSGVGSLPEPSCAPIRVAFATGQAAPSPKVAARMRELAALLHEHPGATVVIDGHADSLGSDELNLRLSKRRAEALAWVLQSVGVEPKRITSRGFGAFSPLEGTQEDAEINRRAVIHVRGACPRGFTEVLGP